MHTGVFVSVYNRMSLLSPSLCQCFLSSLLNVLIYHSISYFLPSEFTSVVNMPSFRMAPCVSSLCIVNCFWFFTASCSFSRFFHSVFSFPFLCIFAPFTLSPNVSPLLLYFLFCLSPLFCVICFCSPPFTF